MHTLNSRYCQPQHQHPQRCLGAAMDCMGMLGLRMGIAIHCIKLSIVHHAENVSTTSVVDGDGVCLCASSASHGEFSMP